MKRIKADIDFTFAVTGTFYGSIVIAGSEGCNIFHKIKKINLWLLSFLLDGSIKQ